MDGGRGQECLDLSDIATHLQQNKIRPKVQNIFLAGPGYAGPPEPFSHVAKCFHDEGKEKNIYISLIFFLFLLLPKYPEEKISFLTHYSRRWWDILRIVACPCHKNLFLTYVFPDGSPLFSPKKKTKKLLGFFF